MTEITIGKTSNKERIGEQLNILGAYNAQRDNIVNRAVAAGYTIYEISRRTHLSRNTIYRILRRPDGPSQEV